MTTPALQGALAALRLTYRDVEAYREYPDRVEVDTRDGRRHTWEKSMDERLDNPRGRKPNHVSEILPRVMKAARQDKN